MKTLIAAVMIALGFASAPAQAWGDREQGALAGLIIGAIIANQDRQNDRHTGERPPVVIGGPQVIVTPQPYPTHRHPPVYREYPYDHPVYVPQPRVCHRYPYEIDQYGNVRAWRLVCR